MVVGFNTDQTAITGAVDAVETGWHGIEAWRLGNRRLASKSVKMFHSLKSRFTSG